MMENTNIISFKKLITPSELQEKYKLTKEIEEHVINSRKEIQDIIHKRSKKNY